jgi:hypothetical protein
MSAAPACRVCGCTDEHACNPPCAWFDPTLCTTCALAAEALRGWSEAAVKPWFAGLVQEAMGIPQAVINPRSEINLDLVILVSRTLAERAAYIAENADAIGVRIELEGRWQNKSLSELPTAYALVEGFRLLLRAEQPHRKIETAEAKP